MHLTLVVAFVLGFAMLVLQCQCGKTLTAPAGSHARRGVCPSCGETLPLPQSLEPVVGEPQRLGELLGHQTTIRAATFSPDGQLLATVAGNQADDGPTAAEVVPEIRIWDVKKRRLVASMQGHQDAVLCARFLPDSQTMVTGGADGRLIVWDVSRGMHNVVMGLKLCTLRGHSGKVTGVSVRTDGAQLISAGDDGELRVWDAATWRCVQVVPTRREGACRVMHSPNGELLAAAWHSPGPTLIWHLKSWQEHVRLVLRADEDGEVHDMAFSPDGNFLAVLGADLLRVWDLSSCQVAVAIDARGMRSLAFSPDGRLIATAGWELKTRHEVLLWDAQTGDCLAHLSGQHDGLNTVCFSPRGDRLACAGRDLAVHLWEV